MVCRRPDCHALRTPLSPGLHAEGGAVAPRFRFPFPFPVSRFPFPRRFHPTSFLAAYAMPTPSIPVHTQPAVFMAKRMRLNSAVSLTCG